MPIMQSVVIQGESALRGAMSRIQAFPTPVIQAVSLPDDYHDAYGDDPYVDCPHDDYQDNGPEEE